MVIGLADAIAARLENVGCWVCLRSSLGSSSVYVIATRIYGEIGNAKYSEYEIRGGDHQPTHDPRPNLCIDVGIMAYADIHLKSHGNSCSGLYYVDADVWSEAVAEAFKAAQKGLESDTRTDPESAVRKLGGDQAWDRLEKAKADDQRVEGAIFGRVKDGFAVDPGDAVAVLPFEWADVSRFRWVELLAEQQNVRQPFKVMDLDRRWHRIEVARWEVWKIFEQRAKQRAEVISSLSEGQTVEGVVKNITEYGAFVDPGGVDGLLHVTDMAWHRVSHPSEILTISETIKVQVIKINKETRRISLGMKQLQDNPWDLVAAKYPLGSIHQGRVTEITDYGAFVELEAGVEGLVHVSEMSWTKKNVHPGKIVSPSQEVDVMVLEIDATKRRVSLSLKQIQRNLWEVFAETHPEGTEVEGEVKNITEFGLFIGLEGDIDGMVHLSDLSWDERGEDAIQNYRKCDVVQAVVSEVDVEKERISLSIKALGGGKAE